MQLSEAQILMLNMSDEDIKNNRIVSQEELDKMDLKWLKKLQFGLKLLLSSDKEGATLKYTEKNRNFAM